MIGGKAVSLFWSRLDWPMFATHEDSLPTSRKPESSQDVSFGWAFIILFVSGDIGRRTPDSEESTVVLDIFRLSSVTNPKSVPKRST